MVDSAVSRRQESELRRLQLQQQQQNADRSFGLAQNQFDYRKEADSQDRQRQAERDKVGDQRWQTELGLNKRNADRSYGLQAQSAKLARDQFDFKVEAMKRQQRLEEEMPMVKAAWDRLDAGIMDDETMRLINMASDDNPLSPKRLYGQDKIQTVRDINVLMPQVNDGTLDYNDPAVIRSTNKVFSDVIQRNIGEKDPATGKTIKDKELAHIGLTEDGKGIFFTLKTIYDDGSSSFKPMTQNASADERDNLAIIPIERAFERFRGYSQMVGAANDPRLAQFMNKHVNGDSKNERAEAKEYRTQAIRLDTEEAKAIAKDPDNAVTIRAQFDQARSRLDEAFGKQPKDSVAPMLQQWAGNDPGKAAFVQKAMAASVFSGGVTPEQLDAKYEEYQRGQISQKNQQTAQQLRERAQSMSLPYSR
ncbi:hypothetical protein DDT56_23465 [Brenneria corticis]|uniref:Uncharacterized protein n=2 Tax=Brenneria corticis TaxID=2173106 RepID=A0A2U1TJY5_9GAMM|nr:hypothetical protein DDT56_23465 [Brenneria sp. CFCC 11842]